jgi:hypothetical protein
VVHRATSVNDEYVLLNVERDLVSGLILIRFFVLVLLDNFVIAKIRIRVNLVLTNFARTYNISFVFSRHKVRHNRDRYRLGTVGAFFPQPARLLSEVVSYQEHEVLVRNIFTLLLGQTHFCTVIILCKSDFGIVVE